jgi:hypothetical protein
VESLFYSIFTHTSDFVQTQIEAKILTEAFTTTLERRLQLTVRTPSSILVLTFYSNIGLGRNRCRWKAEKKLYKLNIRMAINSLRTERFSHPDDPAENSRITFRTRKTWPVRTRVPQNPFLTRFRAF